MSAVLAGCNDVDRAGGDSQGKANAKAVVDDATVERWVMEAADEIKVRSMMHEEQPPWDTYAEGKKTIAFSKGIGVLGDDGPTVAVSVLFGDGEPHVALIFQPATHMVGGRDFTTEDGHDVVTYDLDVRWDDGESSQITFYKNSEDDAVLRVLGPDDAFIQHLQSHSVFSFRVPLQVDQVVTWPIYIRDARRAIAIAQGKDPYEHVRVTSRSWNQGLKRMGSIFIPVKSNAAFGITMTLTDAWTATDLFIDLPERVPGHGGQGYADIQFVYGNGSESEVFSCNGNVWGEEFKGGVYDGKPTFERTFGGAGPALIDGYGERCVAMKISIRTDKYQSRVYELTLMGYMDARKKVQEGFSSAR